MGGNPGRQSRESILEAIWEAILRSIWGDDLGMQSWEAILGGNPVGGSPGRQPGRQSGKQYWEAILGGNPGSPSWKQLGEAIWGAIPVGSRWKAILGSNSEAIWEAIQEAIRQAIRGAIREAIREASRKVIRSSGFRRKVFANLGGNTGRQCCEAILGGNTWRQFERQSGATVFGGKLLLLLYQDPLGSLTPKAVWGKIR